MKSLLSWQLTFLMMLSPSGVWANTLDPLWEKALAHFNVLKHWAAKDAVEEIIQERAGVIKTVRAHKQLAAWAQGKPEYKVIQIEPASASEKVANAMAPIMAQVESLMFAPDATLKGTRRVMLGTEEAILLDLSGSGSTLKLWVKPETGEPLQYSVQFDIPLTFQGTVHCQFSTGPQGMRFPTSRKVDVQVKIPFKKSHIKMDGKYTDWVKQSEPK